LFIASLLTGAIVSTIFALAANHRAQEALAEKRRADNNAVRADNEARESQRMAREAQSQARLARTGLYNASLLRLQDVVRHDPQLAQQLLHDNDRFPEECREFTWFLYDSVTRYDPPHFLPTRSPVHALALSADATKLAAVLADGNACLWAPATDVVGRMLRRGKESFTSIAFSPDGTQLASGDTAGAVALWKMPDIRIVSRFQKHCTLGDCLPGAGRVDRLCAEAEKAGNQVAEFMSVGRFG
jgi:hypothetical protein